MDEAELAALQNDSVAALARASFDPKHVLTGEAAALLLAIPALCDEIRGLRAVMEELAPAPAEVVRLHELLMNYGRHNEGCSAAFGATYRCRCGWREVEPEFTVQNAAEEAGDGDD